MKFKYYLRGCGLGILFATIVLTAAFHSKNRSMDDAAIMERASELGMVKAETDAKSAKESTQADHKDQSGTQKTDSTEPDTQQPAVPDNTAADTQEAEDEPQDTPENAGQTPETDTQVSDQVTITIRNGEVCRELAEDLQSQGMIEDAESFRKFMQQHGYDDQIRVGTYELTRGMSEQEIAKILISR